MKLVAAFSLMALVTFACSSHKGKTGGGGPTSGGPPAGAAECKADDECVVVETGCCDHCNGGKAQAFPKGKEAGHGPTGCTDIACTEMACGPALPKCEAGKCTVKIGELK